MAPQALGSPKSQLLSLYSLTCLPYSLNFEESFHFHNYIIINIVIIERLNNPQKTITHSSQQIFTKLITINIFTISITIYSLTRSESCIPIYNFGTSFLKGSIGVLCQHSSIVLYVHSETFLTQGSNSSRGQSHSGIAKRVKGNVYIIQQYSSILKFPLIRIKKNPFSIFTLIF